MDEVNRSDAKRKRLIELPEKVWKALDLDAVRCRRTSTKQVQVLLEAYYDLNYPELRDFNSVRPRVGPTRVLNETGRASKPDYSLNSNGSEDLAGKREAKEQALDTEDVRRDAHERTKKKQQS